MKQWEKIKSNISVSFGVWGRFHRRSGNPWSLENCKEFKEQRQKRRHSGRGTASINSWRLDWDVRRRVPDIKKRGY